VMRKMAVTMVSLDIHQVLSMLSIHSKT
jgi:hypothetical protein